MRRAEPSTGPHAKIARARKHVSDLADETRAYLKAEPAPLSIVPQTSREGIVRLRLRVERSIPITLALILGDCVHNLRSALDILACDLIRQAGGTVTTYSGFPIVDDAQRLPEVIAEKLKGAGEPIHSTVADWQPFNGASNHFWLLHRLDITDKHKLLLTVATAGTALDIADMAAHQLRQAAKQAGSPATEELEIPNLIIRSAKTDCYEDGDIVAEQPTFDGVDRIRYGFDIALREPPLIECQPIVPLANQLITFVEEVVNSFKHHFAEPKDAQRRGLTP